MTGKKLGRRIRLPPIDTILPIKRNPLHECAERKAMCKHIYEFSSMSADKYWRIEDICLYIAFINPFIKDVAKYVNMCRLFQVYTIIDDHLECDWGDLNQNQNMPQLIYAQIEQAFRRLLEDSPSRVSMAEWRPYVVLLYICFEEIFKDCTLVQKRRMSREYLNWVEVEILNEESIKKGAGFNSLEEYLKVRTATIGGRSICAFIEYADGIQITDEEWEQCVDYIDMAGCAMGLSNDFFSYEKELRDQNNNPDSMTNVVGLIMKWEDCSMDVALRKTAKIMTDCEEKCQQMGRHLMDGPDVSTDMEIFLDRVQYVVSGFFAAQAKARRFCEVYPIDE